MRRPAVFSDSGLSLVEVMVAVAVSAIVMLAMMQATLLQSRQVRSIQLSSDYIQVTSSIQLLINNEQACAAALGGKTFDPANTDPQPIQQLSLAAGQPIVEVDHTTKGLRIESLSLKQSLALAPVPVAPSGTWDHSLVQLELRAHKVQSDGKLGAEYVDIFNLGVFTDSSHRIRKCYGNYSSAALCQQMGLPYSPTATPPCQAPILSRLIVRVDPSTCYPTNSNSGSLPGASYAQFSCVSGYAISGMNAGGVDGIMCCKLVVEMTP